MGACEDRPGGWRQGAGAAKGIACRESCDRGRNRGGSGQAGTNEHYARWIDDSNTVEGATEGLAVLLPDDSEALGGRVAILVHRGNVEGGRVGERYGAWIGGAPARDR